MRASRLLSIVILLQSKTRLTAEALAEEFEVSVRTIYRDFDALLAAGVPVVAEKGPGGGFSFEDGWRAKLSGIAAEEAEAMTLIGLPGPADSLGLGRAATAARRKLLAALPADWSVAAGRVGGRFHFDPVEWYRSPDATRGLPLLARAVLDERVVSMTYESWSGVRDWRVEPLGLVQKAGAWYLVARRDAKTQIFRLSNIRVLTVTEERFDRPEDFDLVGFWIKELKRFEKTLRPLTAALRATPEGERRIARLGAWAARAVSEARPLDRRSVKVMLAIESIEDAARLVLGMGGEVEALQPPALRTEVAALAAAAARVHGSSPRRSARG